jgi:tetratricopeptide (TPR) repeat protein
MGPSRSSSHLLGSRNCASQRLNLLLFLFACLSTDLCSIAQTPKSLVNQPTSQQQEDALQKHFDAARTFQISGDQEHAVSEYKVFLAEALRRAATAKSQAGDYVEAAQWFEAGLNMDQQNLELQIDYAQMRLDQGKLQEAKALAEKAVHSDPKNARSRYTLGLILYQLEDYKSAKEHLEAAVLAAPNFAVGYLLGATYLKLNDLTRANLLFDEMTAGLGDTAEIHIVFGRAYRDASYLEQAVQELKKAVAKGPKMPQAHYFLGMAYLERDGESGFSEAVPEFHAEIAVNPGDYRTHYMLGYILLKQYKLREAESELLRAAELDSRNPDPLIYLGQIYADTDRPAQAEESLRRAISLTEDVSRNDYQINRAHYILGRVLLNAARKNEAEQELRKADELRKQATQQARKRIANDYPNVSQDEQFGRPKLDLAASPKEKEQTQAYIEQLKPAIADSYNNLGVIAAGKKDYLAAMDYFSQAGVWSPNLETLDRNLGMAAFYANQYGRAVAPLSKHLERQPDDLRARAALGLSLFGVQNYGKVLDVLRPIQEEVDGDPGLSYAYAVSQVKTGAYPEGIARLRALEKTNSNSADIHTLLGEAFADQGQYAEALDEYHKALAIDPNLEHAHFLAGLALIRQGEPAQAAQEMRAALKLDPQDVSSKYHLAFSLIQMQQQQDALPLLREVIQQDPKHADAYYQLGKLQLEQGDTKSAISNLEAGTKFNPDGDYIHYQLALAYRRVARTEDAEREMKLYQAIKSRQRGRNAAQSK